MVEKKVPAKKPKDYAKLSQKEKFIASARANDADESGAAFEQAIRKIVPPKRNSS